jgi:hypothetical protein
MKHRGITVTYTLNEEHHLSDAKILAKAIKDAINEEIMDEIIKYITNQESVDPEFAKVMDEMLTAKIGNKPTKKREW